MASFGEILKRERELRGISLREISEATKITLRHLEALEDSRIADLPGGLFNKGFIRAYALHVGIDPDEMVNNYLYDVGQMEEQDPLENLRAMIPAEKDKPAPRWRRWAVPGTILIGGLLLFAALSFWPQRDDSPPAPVAARPAVPAPDGPAIRENTADRNPPDRPQEDTGGPPEPPATVQARPAPARPPATDPSPTGPDPGETAEQPEVRPPAGSLARTAPDGSGLTFEMEMRHPARVRILCDGNEVLNKRLVTGERRVFTCRDLRLSTSDSAALRYRVNDERWVIPDTPGSPLEDLRLTPDGLLKPPGDGGDGAGTANTPAAAGTEEEV